MSLRKLAVYLLSPMVLACTDPVRPTAPVNGVRSKTALPLTPCSGSLDVQILIGQQRRPINACAIVPAWRSLAGISVFDQKVGVGHH